MDLRDFIFYAHRGLSQGEKFLDIDEACWHDEGSRNVSPIQADSRFVETSESAFNEGIYQRIFFQVTLQPGFNGRGWGR